VPVSVAQVQQRDVPVQIRAIGTVEPYRTVSIKSQVQGELTEIGFKESQYVNEGDILFKIDARSYEVALRLAEATLAKNIALAKDAESEAAWMKGLFSSDAAAERENEKARAVADAAWAQVDADKAAVDNAKLDLQWCTIRAPFEGYTGSLMVYQGAILKSRETELVVLNQVKPIYVTFSVPENQLGNIEAKAANSALAVDASFPNSSDAPIGGTLAFLDNQADRTTGMIRLRGLFANEDRRLWPGQFVNVALTLAIEGGAILVPTQAIQTGQTGQSVFVVKEDQTVESRPVTPRREVDGWTVVEGGLEADQTVVTDGQLRLVPGSRIQPKNAPAPTSQSTTTKAAS
jgi:membrane fusion protein, multidrug efflux system